MQAPKATTDYAHGQMMGMLVIIQLFDNARESNSTIDLGTLNRVKDIASRDLAEYLDIPEEDVLLLVNEQLRNI